MAYGDFVVPIPGMRKEERIIENLGAADIELTAVWWNASPASLSKPAKRKANVPCATV